MRMDYRSFEELPAMLTAEELAGALGISRAGAYALIHSKGFPTLRIGKRLMVPKEKLSAWIDRNTSGTE
jgi:excisionase family DNA binding protein